MKTRLSLWMLCFAATISAIGCVMPMEHNLPPAERMYHPGPGVDGPGPGVMSPAMPTVPPRMGGGIPGASPTVQILFAKPAGIQVRWDVQAENAFDSVPLVVPGRHNFPQANIYRLKLTNIPGREGVELYPTVEVGPTTPRTEAYLAHNAIPIQFTEEDFDQVLSGNFVTKVIYLPDPEFQEYALAGVETLVSTRLDPGVDPITEADRRGAIMAVIRLGNKDVELPGVNGEVTPSIPGNEENGGVVPASYSRMQPGMPGMPAPYGPSPLGPSGLIPNHVAGLTAPQWGIPTSGTPIGLPGPPHLPFGGPAGLKKHTIKRHVRMHLPEPTKHQTIHVREQPGYSYPAPPNRAIIREQTIHPSLPFGQPRMLQHERVH